MEVNVTDAKDAQAMIDKAKNCMEKDLLHQQCRYL